MPRLRKIFPFIHISLANRGQRITKRMNGCAHPIRSSAHPLFIRWRGCPAARTNLGSGVILYLPGVPDPKGFQRARDNLCVRLKNPLGLGFARSGTARGDFIFARRPRPKGFSTPRDNLCVRLKNPLGLGFARTGTARGDFIFARRPRPKGFSTRTRQFMRTFEKPFGSWVRAVRNRRLIGKHCA